MRLPFWTIGDGETLINHERMQVLLDNLPMELRNVAYVSKEWRESQWAANYGDFFQNLADQFAAAVASEESDEVDVEQWQQEILDDAEELDDRIAEFEIEFDAALSWSFASEVGLEGTAYDWAENVFLENAEPMTIVRHAGSKPLVMFAFKQKPQPIIIELIEELLDRGQAHVGRFITLAEQDEDQKAMALEVLDKAWPLADELFEIVLEKILPAMNEREGLFSLAAQWSTAELSLDFPPAERPLPLPEMAGAFKLLNRDLFLSGCQEMYGVFDKVVELVREIAPDSVPENYEIPRPQQEELNGATRFYYPEFSQAVPFEGFEPQVIVSNDAVVFGYSSRQVLDLKEDKPLATRPAWLSPKMPVACMSMVDAAGMVNAVSPWLSYGFQLTLGDLDTPVAMNNGPVPTGGDIVQIWECLSTLGKIASTTVIDNEGVTVSRWVWIGE